jgi:hypothetical protein
MVIQNVARGRYDNKTICTGPISFFHIPPCLSLIQLQLIRCCINSASFQGQKSSKTERRRTWGLTWHKIKQRTRDRTWCMRESDTLRRMRLILNARFQRLYLILPHLTSMSKYQALFSQTNTEVLTGTSRLCTDPDAPSVTKRCKQNDQV